MLEHKGLYWSKVPGTEAARTAEPDRDYILPLGKAKMVQAAAPAEIEQGNSCVVITYGMGVYWALAASKTFAGQVEIVDLRTLAPLDEAMIEAAIRRHGKCLMLTEEQQSHSFMESLAGRMSHRCFQQLDAPIEVMGALDLPAVPMNTILEQAMLPNVNTVMSRLKALLDA
jgi:2-oxoisovalerate dehydrogenase E1 component